MTVVPGKTACYRCVFGEPPSEATSSPVQGPLGVVPGVIGTIQAAEAIKYILGIGELLTSHVLTFDSLSMEFRKIPVNRRNTCRCGTGADRKARVDG